MSIEILEPRIAPAAFTVLNLSNAGAGSLRQAVLDANSNDPALGPDTIKFAPGLSGTLTLASPINVSGDVKIVGNGKVTLSGGGANRIFLITNFVAATVDVTLAKLEFVAGFQASDGGAIFNQENLTLKKCVFAQNEAGGTGGAVSSANGTLTIIGCRFLGNYAGGNGGGFYQSDGELAVVNSRFSGNQAGGSSGGGGGYFDGNVAMVESSSFSGNRALSGFGGGMYFGNVTPSGGVAKITVAGSKFAGNVSDKTGGGVALRYGWDSITIAGSTFTGNGSKQAGGGVSVESATPLITIKGSVFGDNTVGVHGAGAYGAGLFLKGVETVKIAGSKFTGNATLDTGDGGGIVFWDQDSVTLKNCVIKGNSARDGGGLFIASIPEPVRLIACLVSGNTAISNPDIRGSFVVV